MAVKLGSDCKLYYSTTLFTEATGAPGGTVNELTNVTNVDLGLQRDKADITTRATAAGGFKAYRSTLAEGTITFEMNWDTTDAGFAAIQTAFFAKSEIAIAAMDGAIATEGNTGLAGNFTVANFSRSEPLTEAAKANVELAVSSYPHWYTVPGS